MSLSVDCIAVPFCYAIQLSPLMPASLTLAGFGSHPAHRPRLRQSRRSERPCTTSRTFSSGYSLLSANLNFSVSIDVGLSSKFLSRPFFGVHSLFVVLLSASSSCCVAALLHCYVVVLTMLLSSPVFLAASLGADQHAGNSIVNHVAFWALPFYSPHPVESRLETPVSIPFFPFPNSLKEIIKRKKKNLKRNTLLSTFPLLLVSSSL